MYPWFKEKNVEILKNTRCVEITKKGVTVVTKEGTRSFIEGNSVMVLMPQVISQEFIDAIKRHTPEVHFVGSTLGADNGLLKHALLDGRTIGCQV